MSFFSTIFQFGKSSYKFLYNTFQFFQEHKILTLTLFFSFMMKYFLADWNSYWLDELYSVYERGIMFDNASEVLEHYRGRTSGMPLYEFILFHWMKLFGHTELATRTLSTIYVTLSTLFLYLFTMRIFGKRVAIATILLYTFSALALYYSLESRYYGQTLFLCTFSSYILTLFLDSLKNSYSWKNILINKYFLLLTFANVALMLTFPFNYLFLVAQGLYVLLHFLYLNREARIINNLIKVLGVYCLQLTIRGIIWDFATFRAIGRMLFGALNQIAISNGNNNVSLGNSYVKLVESPELYSYKDPITIFIYNVLIPNMNLSLYLYVAFFFLLIVLIIKYTVSIYKYNIKSFFLPRKIYIIYVCLWIFIPCFLVYIVYFLRQHHILWPKYIIFCTPPLMILVALALEQGVSLFHYLLKYITRFSLKRHYIRYSLIYAIVATIFITAPQGYQWMNYRKHDWRGIASQIVQQIHRDPDHEYIVFETAWRYPSMLNYYFERFSDQVRVYDIIRRSEERRLGGSDGYAPLFNRAQAIRDILKHDYLLIAFTHHTVNDFSQTLQTLSEQHKLSNSFLDSEGRGYMIFEIQYDTEFDDYKEENIKGGLLFKGEESYVHFNFSPELDTNSSFTFELWVKLLNDITSSTALFGPNTSHNHSYGLYAHYQERLSFGVRTEKDMARVDFYSYLIDTWYHLAGVYNASEREIYYYVDGELIGSDRIDGESLELSAENLGLNLPQTLHGSSAERGHLNCILCEARLWNVARTQEEIKSNMFQKLDGNEDNLLGYWPMNERKGDIVYDLTANQNHGKSYGATWHYNED